MPGEIRRPLLENRVTFPISQRRQLWHQGEEQQMQDTRTPAVMGIFPPQTAEAILAVRWPSVTAYLGGKPAQLGHAIQETAKGLLHWAMGLPNMVLASVALVIVLPFATLIALFAWLLMSPFYFLKLGLVFPIPAPIPGLTTQFMKRYVLTNRRVMVQEGWAQAPGLQVSLADLKEVRVVPGTEHPFFNSADLEFLFGEKGSMTFHGVKEYRTFKAAIENAYLAWGRKDPPKEQKQSAAEMSKATK
jgi:hypothetical protein